MSSRCAWASKSLPLTVQGAVRPSACCSRVVSRMIGPWRAARPVRSVAPCSPPSRTLRAARRARWPAAILDRGCARRLGVVRPGRRNDPCQPNQETLPNGRHWLARQGALVSTHARQRGGVFDATAWSDRSDGSFLHRKETRAPPLSAALLRLLVDDR